MLKLRELRVGMINVTVEAEVVSVGEEIEVVARDGKKYRVAVATLRDETGEFPMALWNDQIDKVEPGARIRVRNGIVYRYRGRVYLASGKRGKLEVLDR